MLDAEPHAQAVELIGFIASECASFFGGIADTVKRYENTGELPKGSIVHGVPEKAKIGKAGRPKAKGEKKEQKAKVLLTTATFSSYTAQILCLPQTACGKQKNIMAYCLL